MENKDHEKRRKLVEDKRAELDKLESETPKFYLGRPVTVLAETHPSHLVTIRFDDTNETENVQNHLVTTNPDPMHPAAPSIVEVRAEHEAKVARERAEKVEKTRKDKDGKTVAVDKTVPVKADRTEQKPEQQPVPENRNWFSK